MLAQNQDPMVTNSFNANARQEVLQNCQEQPLDVIIVGGGITGAGCLRDGAMRGLRIALFEKSDFAYGTSGRSSKLIHGGIRYLETLEWKLVFEASRERKILVTTAPRIVRPLPFLYPVYKDHRRGLFMVSAGISLYYLMSLFRNIGQSRIQGKQKTLQLEPVLQPEKLVGSASYFDAMTHDTTLTMASIQSGWRNGGMACNYAQVIDLIEQDDSVVGVKVRDQVHGKVYEIRSKWVVNATGPWSDAFRESVAKKTSKYLRPTKGVHIILEHKKVGNQRAILMHSPSDGRVTFSIPWHGFSLIGTTDTDFHGDPDHVTANEDDVDYLLETVNHYFPNAKVKQADVISTYAGLRPLIRDDHSDPSSVSREHRIFSDQRGLVSIVGGKLTSFRQMAEELLDWIIDHTPEWKNEYQPCQTRSSMIESTNPLKDLEKTEVISGTGITWGEIDFAINNQMAVTVEDILSRRTPLIYLDREHGLGVSAEIAKRLAKKFELNEKTVSKQLRQYAQAAKQATHGL